MSNHIINNNKKIENNELLHINSDSYKREGQVLQFLTKSKGFINGYEIRSKNSFLGEITKAAINEQLMDEPAPEGLGDLYEIRKEIIFGNLIENDYLIGQFILKTQSYIFENAKISTYFLEKTIDIYNKMIILKETVANYCLVIKLYLMRQNYNRALELFLLMLEKNKKIFEFIYKKIKDTFPRISNSNRIAKFFPLIVRKYFEVLSCLIKLSDKFNKPKIQNMIIKYYIKTFDVVRETVLNKFYQKANNNHIELDNKHISNFFYTNIFFDIGIYFFMKYHPFSIIIKLLQHILDIYQACSNTDLKTIEKILLLKTYYNLGLFLYVNGQNYESIQNLSEARNILNNIHHLPLTKEIMNNINEKSGKINEISEVDSPLINKAYLTKNSSNTTIDEIKKEDKNPKYIIRKKMSINKTSSILFGKDINNFEFINENIEDKIYNEIELLLAEIELSSNDQNQVLKHINKLLKGKNHIKKVGHVHFNSGYSIKSEKEENFCNYNLLSDFDKRKIMFLLEKMGNKYKDNSMDKIYKNNKNSQNVKHSSSKEMEKFFLFICSLSDYQLRILNETQPKESILRNNMPIIFTNQFKDLLMNSQRVNLTLLETMGLSRYLILKNPNKDICPDNLDFTYMQYNIKGVKIKKKRNKSKINDVDNKKNQEITISSYKKNETNGSKNLKEKTANKLKEKDEFNKMLNDIINEKNKNFIEMFRESIINILINLNENDKKLIRNSKIFFNDLINKMEKGLIIY